MYKCQIKMIHMSKCDVIWQIKSQLIKESWLFIIGKMPQNTARLKFLAYGGLYSVEGSEDPTQIFVKGYIFFKWSQMVYNLALVSPIW